MNAVNQSSLPDMRAKADLSLRLLMVDDNLDDHAFVQRELLSADGGRYLTLESAVTLADGLKSLSNNDYDLILLDLSLPDSDGLETFRKVYNQVTVIPVIVLTGHNDENTGVTAMRTGAQDYLIKGEIDGKLLIRAIRYAIERARLMAALLLERQKKHEEWEAQFFKRLSAPFPQSITARLFGSGPLREILPDSFEKLVSQYADIMDQYLEHRSYKIDYDASEALRETGEELGFLKAQPRDIIELHLSALKRKQTGATPQKQKAYAEEGRLILIELMGFLAAYYRKYAIAGK